MRPTADYLPGVLLLSRCRTLTSSASLGPTSSTVSASPLAARRDVLNLLRSPLSGDATIACFSLNLPQSITAPSVEHLQLKLPAGIRPYSLVAFHDMRDLRNKACSRNQRREHIRLKETRVLNQTVVGRERLQRGLGLRPLLAVNLSGIVPQLCETAL